MTYQDAENNNAAEGAEDLQLVLTEDGPGEIRVDLEAFFEFSFWLAEELEDLKAQWAHQAAPSSSRNIDPLHRR